MSCERHQDDVNDWMDGTLEASARREFEAHVRACPECAAVVDDLRRIRALANSLERRQPPQTAWEHVARRTVRAGSGRVVRMIPRRAWAPLATAACLVLAVAVVYVLKQPSGGPAGTTARPPAAAGSVDRDAIVGSVEAELRQAALHYENAIQGLEKLAKDQQGVDPQVAATLQKNLQLIDQAIGESRAAVAREPASEPAQESLFEAFRTKIAFLQDTIALVNEMRKGNQAEAAKIAEGLNKS